MTKMHSSTRALTAAGLFGFGTIVVIAGCSGTSSSSSSPTPAITPGAPLQGAACAGMTGGVAYVPDGTALLGSRGSPGHLTIIPFETTDGSFSARCAQTPLTLPFSINALAISSSGIAVALQSDNRYIGIDQLVNGGAPNTFQNPQPFPSPLGSTFTASSLAIVPNGTTGLVLGTTYPGFVGINNFFGAAPTPLPTPTGSPSAAPTPSMAPNSGSTTPTPTVTQTPVPFAGQIPYAGVGSNENANTGLNPVSGNRYSLALAPNGTTMLTRGSDLATFSLDATFSGYFVTFPADTASPITTPPPKGISTRLGFLGGAPPNGNAAKGLIAFYPGDSSQALIGQSTNPLTATQVSGLPNSITSGSLYTLPAAAGRINSLAVTPNDGYAIFGTNAGIYVATLGHGSAPVLASNAPTGLIHSVGVSPDGRFVLAQSGQLLTVYPFSSGTLGVADASHSFSLPAAATGDYLLVR
jgi:hypothetical protein